MSEEIKYCPNCGEQTPGEHKFCESCGFNFETREVVEEAKAKETPKKKLNLKTLGIIGGLIALILFAIYIFGDKQSQEETIPEEAIAADPILEDSLVGNYMIEHSEAEKGLFIEIDKDYHTKYIMTHDNGDGIEGFVINFILKEEDDKFYVIDLEEGYIMEQTFEADRETVAEYEEYTKGPDFDQAREEIDFTIINEGNILRGTSKVLYDTDYLGEWDYIFSEEFTLEKDGDGILISGKLPLVRQPVE